MVLCVISMTGFAQAPTVNTSPQKIFEKPSILHDSDELYFSVMTKSESVDFSRVAYKKTNSELVFSTDQIIEYIEVYKQDKLYLKRIPVFTNNLYINMKNFERGLYKIHMLTNQDDEPVVAHVLKKHSSL